MRAFEFVGPTRLIFGDGSLAGLGRAARTLGQSCLVVSGKKSARRTGVLDQVMEQLREADVRGIAYSSVMPYPYLAKVDEAATIARHAEVDFVLGLGGGSAMDAAKAVALAAGGDRPAQAFVKVGGTSLMRPKRALPIALVPTLAGSGSEFNPHAMLLDPEGKRLEMLSHVMCWPRLSVVDPQLAQNAPTHVTAQGGATILARALESVGFGRGYLADRLAEAVGRTVLRMLPRAVREPAQADPRRELAWASAVAGSGLPQCGRSAVRMLLEIARVIAGFTEIAHGQIAAILMPAWVRFIGGMKPAPVAQLGHALFDVGYSSDQPETGVERTAGALEAWLSQVGLAARFSDYGVKAADLAAWAERLQDEAPAWFAAAARASGAEVTPQRLAEFIEACL